MRTAINDLGTVLADARRRLTELSRSMGDHPQTPDTVVADLVQDACDDVDGWLVGAASAAELAGRFAASRRPALVATHLAEAARVTDLAIASYVTGLGSADSVTRLRDVAAEGRAWQRWSWTVLSGTGSLWTDLTSIRTALERCWTDLVEHVLDDPIEVRTAEARQVALVTDGHAGGQ
jgi:hypothetical protein